MPRRNSTYLLAAGSHSPVPDLDFAPITTDQLHNLDVRILAPECGYVMTPKRPVRMRKLAIAYQVAVAASQARAFACCNRPARAGEPTAVFLGQELHSPAAGAPWCSSCATYPGEPARPRPDCILCGETTTITVVLGTAKHKLVARLCLCCLDEQGYIRTGVHPAS
ncbi:hypothetical protein GCM10022215_15150 [Nocardioides fonticola]|uniref:Uncharacterized protein n=1 Tax=Nocardioides fonticola TaxID=450363 RepID=A0ABP7XGP0_9ACTN